MLRRWRRLIDAVPAREDPHRILLTWDENMAARVVGRRRGALHATGVIWLTDRPAPPSSAVLASLRRCHLLWVLSAAQVAPLTALVGENGPPVRFLRFGIDTEFFSPAPWPVTPLVASVGGDRDRDTDTLYEALDAVHRKAPGVRLVVQTGSRRPAPDGVEVVQHLDHVALRRLYAAMSVMVIATRPNTHVSGMTVGLEARATGRPLVVTSSPGDGDYLTPGEDAVVVAQGDSAALADGVLSLLGSPAEAQAMGKRGRAAVEARHTQEHMADALLDLLSRTTP